MNSKKVFNKIAYHLRDCYGLDKLSKHLYIGGLLLSLSRFTSTLGLISVFYGTWRCFSKNKYRRYQELSAYETRLLAVKQRFDKSKANVIQLKDYKIFKCPNCSQKLRVPRGKGKIIISCKKCHTEFRGKS